MAAFADQRPHLRFKASDPEKQIVIFDEIAASALARVDATDLGDPHWHTAHLEVPAYSMQDTINLLSGLLMAFTGPRIRAGAGWGGKCSWSLLRNQLLIGKQKGAWLRRQSFTHICAFLPLARGTSAKRSRAEASRPWQPSVPSH